MDFYLIILILLTFTLCAFLLGLRDKKSYRARLIKKLKKNYGDSPKRQYKDDDLAHLDGYYLNHKEEFSIDDTTWNDLKMDYVFARINYCLSSAGEEYLYYMLRNPKQEDDFDKLEKQIKFFQNNDEKRLKAQLIYAEISGTRKYSIYDYINLLKKGVDVSNTRHFVMLFLMLLAVVFMFFNFAMGFICLVILMFANILLYFKGKDKTDPFIVTFGYIMRIIASIDNLVTLEGEEFAEDISKLKEIKKEFSFFKAGSSILLSPGRMNAGSNPADLIMDYVRMITHIDIIKFNQMYKEVMARRESLDKILEITGRIEAAISICCYRASLGGHYTVPNFREGSFEVYKLVHPLIADPVDNDVCQEKGMLITGSNASGKSTFLKTCAINALLAQSIHTALAESYSAPMYRIYSSMALNDDIFEGDSYYIVEIKSIKRIIDASKTAGNKILCFVDEVLRGTNTLERIAASTQVLRSLAESGVMCFAATHDIELTELLKSEFDICHFEGMVSDNDVHFDYKIKEGPATTRNAIKLLSVLGYDDAIVSKAESMAQGFLSTGVWS